MSIPLKPDSVKFAVPRRRRARTWVTHLGCRVTETIAIEACQIMTVVTLETKQEERELVRTEHVHAQGGSKE